VRKRRERRRGRGTGTHVLLVELALGLHDPPAADGAVAELVADDGLDERALHGAPELGPVDGPLGVRALALLQEEHLARRHAPLVLARQDLADGEDVVGRAVALGRPRAVVLVLGERLRQGRLEVRREAVEARVDLVQRHGARDALAHELRLRADEVEDDAEDRRDVRVVQVLRVRAEELRATWKRVRGGTQELRGERVEAAPGRASGCGSAPR